MNKERVDHPDHYQSGDPTYETINVIEAWDLDFCLGNAIKYISRAGKKGDQIEDLEKAAWYINRKIEKLRNDRAANTIKEDKGTRGSGVLCDKVGEDQQERHTRPYRYTATLGRVIY